MSVRGKNSKEKLSGFFKTVTQSVDEVLLSNQKDKDEFFEHQRSFLVEYFSRVRDATMRSDKMTKSHKSTSEIMLTTIVFDDLLALLLRVIVKQSKEVFNSAIIKLQLYLTNPMRLCQINKCGRVVSHWNSKKIVLVLLTLVGRDVNP